ncbi:MAG TPA: multicopper oxidase domain-containing protein [Longimicrobiales bacterium]
MNRRWLAVFFVFAVVVTAAFFARAGAGGGQTRTYYVAADTITWDMAPSGRNGISGQPFNAVEKMFAEPGPHYIGHTLKKAVFREYTDSTFRQLKPRPAEWQHLGILGPLLRAEVGDTIRVVFRNHTGLHVSMHPHGVFYKKDSEGAPYADGTGTAEKGDDGVAPGGSYTYVWPVPERAGPTEHEGSTAFWMYHSHVDEIRDVNSGLLGPMVITRKGMARADGSPKDIDREIIATLYEFDENYSWFVQENIARHATRPKEVTMAIGPFGNQSVVSNSGGLPDFGAFFRETINGFYYGNTPGMTMQEGQKVRWYVMATTNFEIHAPHWHGNVVTINSMRTDVAALLPMGMLIADMKPDNAGQWLFHCHVADHLRMGMQAMYTVAPVAVAAR